MILASHFAYWGAVFLMMAGLYVVIARTNLVKKLVGMSLLQSSVYILYVAPGKLVGATSPIIAPGIERYVLIPTAIVVGVATLALGLALAVRIRESYGTIEEDEILAADAAVEERQAQ
jgi:multicomponent Na+:H+ antiporter subunit C